MEDLADRRQVEFEGEEFDEELYRAKTAGPSDGS
jgi:hypothetical protein